MPHQPENLSDDITGIPTVNSAGQGGLLGITIDPQFSSNRMVYWCFSESTPEGNETAVAKGRLSADEKRIENATVIYRATPLSTVPYTMEEEFFLTGAAICSSALVNALI